MHVCPPGTFCTQLNGWSERNKQQLGSAWFISPTDIFCISKEETSLSNTVSHLQTLICAHTFLFLRQQVSLFEAKGALASQQRDNVKNHVCPWVLSHNDLCQVSFNTKSWTKVVKVIWLAMYSSFYGNLSSFKYHTCYSWFQDEKWFVYNNTCKWLNHFVSFLLKTLLWHLINFSIYRRQCLL